MRLLVTTPVEIVVDASPVNAIRAEDSTGAFGILPGHADFITVLSISVLTWRNGEGQEHHVALRGGILSVRDGNLVEVATREAIREDSLIELGPAVLERFREERSAERTSSISSRRLQFAAVRQLQRYLESGRRTSAAQPVAGQYPDGGEN